MTLDELKGLAKVAAREAPGGRAFVQRPFNGTTVGCTAVLGRRNVFNYSFRIGGQMVGYHKIRRFMA